MRLRLGLDWDEIETGSSKSAFTTFLSGLRNRLSKKNIHVLTVLPGFVDTKMTKNWSKN